MKDAGFISRRLFLYKSLSSENAIIQFEVKQLKIKKRAFILCDSKKNKCGKLH
jgi:hypothetical protein